MRYASVVKLIGDVPVFVFAGHDSRVLSLTGWSANKHSGGQPDSFAFGRQIV